MQNKFNFTKQNLAILAPAEKGKRVYVYDKRINGLGLSVTAAGTKSFIVYRKVNNKPMRVTLGRFPDMTLDQARRNAEKALSKMSDGINLIDEKRQQRVVGIKLAEVFEEYLSARNNLKESTITDYQKAMKETFSDWLDKPMQSLTKDMIMRRHKMRGKDSKARANNAFRVLRALFNFAKHKYEDSKGQSLFADNPVDRLSVTKSWFKVKRKQTYLTVADLPKWYHAVNSLPSATRLSKADVVKDYLLFLLFTGLRREEAASLLWEDVSFHDKTFTLIDTKNNEVVTLPMSTFIDDLMHKRHKDSTSDYVFPGEGKKGYVVEPRKQMVKVSEQSGINFTLHDLRRTFATIGESLDIGHYTLKRLLNHKLNTENDVTAGYVIANPERLRSASQRICDYMLLMINKG